MECKDFPWSFKFPCISFTLACRPHPLITPNTVKIRHQKNKIHIANLSRAKGFRTCMK